ncbi:MAG TPA: LuxR C-terminal-related transcriptional regulator [Actinomycetota bacterium]|nr:LuxR C-terminal-related transcriptional regulator [Actinomycetota bacterium]
MYGVFRRAKRATSGWESLTRSERRIVELVAEGLSNPQIGERLFVSRRTVSTHLYRIFKKLDVASRAELTALAVRRLST